MTKTWLTIFISLLIGCSDDKSKQAFPTVDRREINHIVEAVIRHDSLPFHKTSDTSFIPLSTKLRKIYVTAQDAMPDIPPPVDRQKIPKQFSWHFHSWQGFNGENCDNRTGNDQFNSRQEVKHSLLWLDNSNIIQKPNKSLRWID